MEKSEFKQLKEQLLSHRKNGYDRMPETEQAAMEPTAPTTRSSWTRARPWA